MDRRISNLQRLGINLPHVDTLPANDTHRLPVPPTMLSLVFRTGQTVAFSYAHLYKIDFDGQREITLHFSSHSVTLLGDGLAQLFKQLCCQDVHEIGELDPIHSQLHLPQERVVTIAIITLG